MKILNNLARTFLSSLILFTFSSCAYSQIITVDAKGKNKTVAETNAKVNATRQIMLSITEDQFIKSHTKEIRKGIIAQADKFVTDVKIVNQTNHGDVIVISAEVNVDKIKLAEYLKSMGATIVRSYQDVYSDRLSAEKTSLTKFFGSEVKQVVYSEISSENNSQSAVSEELIVGADISLNGRTELEPGEISPLYFKLPEFDPLTSNHTYSYVTINEPNTPTDYESSCNNAVIEGKYFSSSKIDGFHFFQAPSRAGQYEIRLFAGANKKEVMIARLGFSVKSSNAVKYKIERSTYSPEENVYVDIDIFDNMQDYFLLVASSDQTDTKLKEIKKLTNSFYFKDLSIPQVNFKAPKEPGDYVILLFRACTDCYNSKSYNNQPAIAQLKFKVSSINSSFDNPLLSVPPEVISGSKMSFLFGCPNDWKNEPIAFYSRKKGNSETTGIGILRCNDKSYVSAKTSDLFELGDYEIVAEKGEGENLKRVIGDFSVIENLFDKNNTPSMDTFSEVEQDSSIIVSGKSLIQWENPVLVIVPKGFSKDAKDAIEYGKATRVNLNHSQSYFTNFSIIEKPGDYELRIYDKDNDQGKIQISRAIHVMTDAEMQKHKAEIKAKVDEYINDPNDSSLEFKKSLIENFKVPQPPHKQSLLTRSVLEIPSDDFQLPSTKVALSTKDCDSYVNDYIRNSSRIDITLGREGDFEGELAEFGKTLLFNVSLPEKSYLEKFQKGMEEVKDMYKDTIAGMDKLSEGDYAGALKTGMTRMLKVALKHCSSEECLTKLLTGNSSKLKERMARMTDKQYSNVYNTLQIAIGKSKKGKGFLKDLANYRETIAKDAKFLSDNADTISNIMDVTEDVSTLAGTVAGGDYTNKEAYANAILSILAIEYPIGVASIKLSYQAYLSAHDFANDVSVLRMYGKWKKVGGDSKGSLGYDDFAKIWKDDWQHHKDRVMMQARKVMVNTMGNELTRKVLTKSNRRRAETYFYYLRDFGWDYAKDYIVKSDFISDEEVYDFLEVQFAEWEKAENLNRAYAKSAKNIYGEFRKIGIENSDCSSNFYSWFSGMSEAERAKLGWGSRTDKYLSDGVHSLWTKGCSREVEAFKAYYKLRKDIEMELNSWNDGNKKCDKRSIQSETQEMLCALVESKDRFYNKLANYACSCGWDANYLNGEILLGDEISKYRREAEVVGVMEAVDNNKVLNCLCNYGRVSHGHASHTVSISYNPGKTGLAPGGVCGENQRGACFASGWSCWHFTLPTDEKGLEKCNYYGALKEAKEKNKIGDITDQVNQCNADFDDILRKAQEKQEQRRKRELRENSKI